MSAPATRYAYLGPEGTFTEAALRSLPLGDGSELVPVPSVPTALDHVRRGDADAAMVPIENSVEGAITATLDELAAGERERAYESLLGTLGLEDDPAPRDLLARRLGSDEVGRGRWRARARGPAGWALARRYRRTLDELERESNHAARPLIEAYERLG
jgi:hypothetical protein